MMQWGYAGPRSNLCVFYPQYSERQLTCRTLWSKEMRFFIKAAYITGIGDLGEFSVYFDCGERDLRDTS